jgi:hypothetical protein
MKNYKSISVWCNRGTGDECYAVLNQALLDELGEKVSWMEGLDIRNFYIEMEGKDCVMYAYDGIGLLCITSDEYPEVVMADYLEALQH